MNLQTLSHENYFYWYFISSLANIFRHNKSFFICSFNIQGLSEIKHGLYLQFFHEYMNSYVFSHYRKTQAVTEAIHKPKIFIKMSIALQANSLNTRKLQLKKRVQVKFATLFQINPNFQKLSRKSINFKFPLRNRNYSIYLKKLRRVKILNINSINFSKNGVKQQLMAKTFLYSTNLRKNILGKQWHELIKLRLKKKFVNKANSLTNQTNSITFFSYQSTIYFLLILNYSCTFCQKNTINQTLSQSKFISENVNVFFIHQKSILQNYFFLFPCIGKSLNSNFSKKSSIKLLEKITTYMFRQKNDFHTQPLLLIYTPSLNLNQTHSLFNKLISHAIRFRPILNKFYSLTNFQFKHFLYIQFFSFTQKINKKNKLAKLTLSKIKEFCTVSQTHSSSFQNRILEKKKKKTFSILLSRIISNWFVFFIFLASLKVLIHLVSKASEKQIKESVSIFHFHNVTTFKKFFMIRKSTSLNFEEFKRIISIFFKNQGLEIVTSKTYTFSIEKKIDLQNLKRKEKKEICLKKDKFELASLTNLFFYISHFSIKLHFFKIKKILKYESNLSLNILIIKLNREIRCWSAFYSLFKISFSFHLNLTLSNKNRELIILKKMNKYLDHLLWNWVKKRHNQQSNYWIFARYWTLNIKKNYWIFSTQNATFKRKYYLMNYALIFKFVIQRSSLIFNEKLRFI
nr:hypothetical protein [Microspora sp. UTEX LB472]